MLNSNALEWLEEIFFDRFEVSIKIVPTDNSYDLVITDTGTLISINTSFSYFSANTSEMEYCEITPEKFNFFSLNVPKLAAPGLKIEKIPSENIFAQKEGKIIINYDVIGMMHWCLSRLEEIDGLQLLDKFGRFQANQSFAFKHNYLQEPIVDQWFIVIKKLLLFKCPNLSFKINNFKFLISHDIDTPYLFTKGITKNIKTIIYHARKEKSLSELFRLSVLLLQVKFGIFQKDPFFTFEFIMDTIENKNLKSVFYFPANTSSGPMDPTYCLSDEKIVATIKNIITRGHKIGFHPSFETFKNQNQLNNEFTELKMRLNEMNAHTTVKTARMHYLRISYPDTLYLLKSIGVEKDSTMGYADCPGFRAGTCFTYPAFDPIENKKIGIEIEPLVVMDNTVFDAKYLNVRDEKAAETLIKELHKSCKFVGGQFSLLWHNSELITAKRKRAFLKVLDA